MLGVARLSLWERPQGSPTSYTFTHVASRQLSSKFWENAISKANAPVPTNTSLHTQFEQGRTVHRTSLE